MKLVLALLTSLMFLTACEMQQDPLSGASDQVREGRLPDTNKPVAEKPLPKEAMQIDAPVLVNGRVGSQMEFKILGRVMTPDVGFTLSIDNLADFPGATFDAATGDFKWTPVKALVGGRPSVELVLRITLSTQSTEKNPTISVEKKAVSLVVVNSYSKPIVNTVTGQAQLLVGKNYTMEFQVEDIDAFSEDDVTVMIRDCPSNYYSDSIAHLVEVKKVKTDTANPGKYVGELSIGLSSADMLPSGNYCFGLVAVSKHGVSSELYKKEVSVEAKLKNTKMTMNLAPVLKVGEIAQVAFSIYDPSGNGILAMTAMDDIAAILPGSSLSCKHGGSAKSQLDCSGIINTTGAEAKVYSLNMEVENSTSRSNQKVTTRHTLRINVKAATP